MKVYWVSEIFETDVIDIDALHLFQTEKQAQNYADELDNEMLIAWKQTEAIRLARWTQDQMIIEALEKIGIDWKQSFPRHKTMWEKRPFNRRYEVRSLNVETMD